MALSIASSLDQPWSGITSGRYVAVRVDLPLPPRNLLPPKAEEEEGFGNEI
jgi:hypothetical protein